MKSALAALLAAGLISERARAADGASVEVASPQPAAARNGPGTVFVAARPDGGLWLADLFVNLFAIGVQAAALHDREERDSSLDDSWGRSIERRERVDQSAGRYGGYRAYRPRHDARQGFLFAIGVGGGQLRVSGADPNGGPGRTGALDVGLRMGYGFSDRFQLFGDLTADVGTFGLGQDVTNWVLSLRGQTVLIGDREGNGLNLNLGFGLGGTSISYGTPGIETSSPAALALVGGLSYDARVARQFSLSPELYVSWHRVPNPGFAADNATTVGLRLNFLWYAP